MSQLSNILTQFTRGVMNRGQRGLYGGKQIIFGNTICFSNKKSRRNWKPNVQSKTYHSDILDTDLRVKVTCHTIRCIDKAGNFDNYIMKTSHKNLSSELGSDLKNTMKMALQHKAQLILFKED
ncbi:hypothetical protein DLAC_05912 [Tieghemostelium lacteum]|uniref:Large ribosomal subunit protein bL28m n=1 Tax=Tieghemostelium lacteum TaxID=361077 RepID=A0A151ZH62_TIELA|nr:hypothetical protein DLAC_05912 [Tieghemostelium lacteum]|eukprot:KYQ93257.1 hypothetical protein DLAC_05912 [Tieghemostelium lacteum]